MRNSVNLYSKKCINLIRTVNKTKCKTYELFKYISTFNFLILVFHFWDFVFGLYLPYCVLFTFSWKIENKKNIYKNEKIYKMKMYWKTLNKSVFK